MIVEKKTENQGGGWKNLDMRDEVRRVELFFTFPR